MTASRGADGSAPPRPLQRAPMMAAWYGASGEERSRDATPPATPTEAVLQTTETPWGATPVPPPPYMPPLHELYGPEVPRRSLGRWPSGP